MTTFAKVRNGIVQRVIVAAPSFFDTFVDDTSGPWIETSKDIRKNYAGVGYSYDKSRDAFIPPKPFPSWVLDDATCLWDPPVPLPSDGKNYGWNESTQSWDEVII